jgi:hypothetical protein
VVATLPTRRTTQRIHAHRHPCIQWDSNPRSQLPGKRRQFMLQITRLLRPAEQFSLAIIFYICIRKVPGSNLGRAASYHGCDFSWSYLVSPLWSSGQSSWLQIQRSRVWFPALPDYLRSSGSGTGSTQPREYNWGPNWMERSGSGSRKPRLTVVGIRCADHATPSIRKS